MAEVGAERLGKELGRRGPHAAGVATGIEDRVTERHDSKRHGLHRRWGIEERQGRRVRASLGFSLTQASTARRAARATRGRTYGFARRSRSCPLNSGAR